MNPGEDLYCAVNTKEIEPLTEEKLCELINNGTDFRVYSDNLEDLETKAVAKFGNDYQVFFLDIKKVTQEDEKGPYSVLSATLTYVPKD